MSELKEIAAKAAELLPEAFTWCDTPQGHVYWAQVRLDLLKLAKLEDDGLFPPMFESELRGTAPLKNETDRKFALELADLIDDLLLYFIAPILDGDEQPFYRWSAVLGNLLDLGGVTEMEEGQILICAEFEEDR